MFTKSLNSKSNLSLKDLRCKMRQAGGEKNFMKKGGNSFLQRGRKKSKGAKILGIKVVDSKVIVES